MYPQEVQLAKGGQVIAVLYPKVLIDEYAWPDIAECGGLTAYKVAKAQAS